MWAMAKLSKCYATTKKGHNRTLTWAIEPEQITLVIFLWQDPCHMDPSNFPVTWPWMFKAAKYASFYIAIQYLCYLYTLSRNDEMMQYFLGFKVHCQERSVLVLDPISSEISVLHLPCLASRVMQRKWHTWMWLTENGTSLQIVRHTEHTSCQGHPQYVVSRIFAPKSLTSGSAALSTFTHNCNLSHYAWTKTPWYRIYDKLLALAPLFTHDLFSPPRSVFLPAQVFCAGETRFATGTSEAFLSPFLRLFN